MFITPGGEWQHVQALPAQTYQCGYSNCGKTVSSERGWQYVRGQWTGTLLICPSCKQPTLFDRASGRQMPGVVLGGEVQKLPENVSALWSEVRTSTGVGAHTAAVLASRTLLMHIAVSQGAEPGKTFLHYVDFLVDNHFAPPNSKIWVDRIRAHGNEATHEIVLKGPNDSKEIMVFLEMLLKFIYEFPHL